MPTRAESQALLQRLLDPSIRANPYAVACGRPGRNLIAWVKAGNDVFEAEGERVFKLCIGA
jgi:hypothetical protein